MLSCGLFSGGQNEVVEVFEQSRALVVREQIVEQGRMLEGTPSPDPAMIFLALQSVSILDLSKQG